MTQLLLCYWMNYDQEKQHIEMTVRYTKHHWFATNMVGHTSSTMSRDVRPVIGYVDSSRVVPASDILIWPFVENKYKICCSQDHYNWKGKMSEQESTNHQMQHGIIITIFLTFSVQKNLRGSVITVARVTK